MSMVIQQNLSPYYKNTENVKSYGSSGANKKDTTNGAAKETTSQYSGDAVVEFSGDGMAALEKSKDGAVKEKSMRVSFGNGGVHSDYCRNDKGKCKPCFAG